MSLELKPDYNRTNITKIQHVYLSLNKRGKLFVLGSLFTLIISIILMASLLPNKKEVKPYAGVGLVINGDIIETKSQPIIEGSTPLISFNDVKEYIDENVFFDNKLNKVIITTPNKVVRIKAEKDTGLINNKPFALNSNVKIENKMPYIPVEQFEDIYNIDVNYFKDNNVVVIDTTNIQVNNGIIKENNVKVRTADDPKPNIICKVNQGQIVRILEKSDTLYKIRINDQVEGYVNKNFIFEEREVKRGIIKANNQEIRKMPSIKQPIVKKVNKEETITIFGEVKDWYKVRSNDGVVGFIKKKAVKNIILVPESDKKNIRQVWKPSTGKINLVWEQIERVTPSMNNVDKVQGLDVVSPTWFEIIDGNGRIKNKADIAYVTWARANGYKVWALVSNGVSSSRTKMTSSFLSNADTRENIINELIYLAQLYELDGLNIDFEYVSVKDKDLLTQFMRELAPLCKDKGLTLSIDVVIKANTDNSLCFDRKRLGETVDYMMVMTYDQYWSTSPVSGSVAQYSWVENSIIDMLKEVPKEKLIMGMPFYTRQWKEVKGEKPVSVSVSMASAQNIIRQYSAKVVWEEASGQHYAEFSKNNAKYRIWLEDAKSINLKSSLALKYDLAGVAAWRRGYEIPDIWGVLNKNLKELKSYDDWKSNNK